MICPFCKTDIDNDSFYCDQCGNEILICPVCKNPGKGKRCTQDGSKLNTAKEFADSKNKVEQFAANSNDGMQQPIQQKTVTQNTYLGNIPDITKGNRELDNDLSGANFIGQPAKNITDIIQIANRKLNIVIRLKDGDVIGRKAGNFTNIFGAYNQISGKHAQILFIQSKGMCIVDLGSSNGTKFGGKTLLPNQPEVIINGATLLLANIEFSVEVFSPNNPDATVRV